MNSRSNFLTTIRGNIESFGTHITFVESNNIPFFGYSIGMTEKNIPECIIAGLSHFENHQIKSIISIACKELEHGQSKFSVEEIGDFHFSPVHESWSETLMLGVLDFYGTNNTSAMQILPVSQLETVDTPRMSQPWSPEIRSAWKWMKEPWPYEGQIPSSSKAITNLSALHGNPVTEMARWENDEWELFSGSGPDTPSDEIRIVPLSTFLTNDKSVCENAVQLSVGKALWRDGIDDEWHRWS